jgi:hypothetical protein
MACAYAPPPPLLEEYSLILDDSAPIIGAYFERRVPFMVSGQLSRDHCDCLEIQDRVVYVSAAQRSNDSILSEGMGNEGFFVDKLNTNIFLLVQNQWTFARGALATVDRPLFGWVGRFFLHNVSKRKGFIFFFRLLYF